MITNMCVIVDSWYNKDLKSKQWLSNKKMVHHAWSVGHDSPTARSTLGFWKLLHFLPENHNHMFSILLFPIGSFMTHFHSSNDNALFDISVPPPIKVCTNAWGLHFQEICSHHVKRPSHVYFTHPTATGIILTLSQDRSWLLREINSQNSSEGSVGWLNWDLVFLVHICY